MARRETKRGELTAALDRVPLQRRYLFWFTYLAALVALQILYLALDDMPLNLALTGALSAGFVYGYFLDSRWRPFTIYWVSALSLGVSIYYYLQIQAQPQFLGNHLGILAGVLIALLAFKAFAPGDHRFILMFCVVILLFGAAASYDLKYMLMLPLFLLAAGGSLYVASQVEIAARVAESSGGQLPPIVTLGRTFYRVLWRAVLGIIALSVIAYIVTPHQARGDRSLIMGSAPTVTSEMEEGVAGDVETSGLVKLDGSDAEVGIGSDFDLTDPRRLSAEPRPVLQVKSHRNGYLRAQIYDYYTGSGWLRSEQMANSHIMLPQDHSASVLHIERDDYNPVNTSFYVPLVDFPSEPTAERLADRKEGRVLEGNRFSVDSQLDLSVETIRQEVKLLEPQPPFYYAMFQPARLQNISLSHSGRMLNNPRLDIGSTVRPRDFDQWHPRGFSYTMHSIEPRYTSRDLEQVSFFGPEEVLAHYTQLPKGNTAPELPEDSTQVIRSWRPISDRFTNFAKQIVAERVPDKPVEQASPYERVQAIYEYLTGSDFHYTRDYQERDSAKEMTESFCLDSKEGYCRHFASSMAVLCRINGVPARIVSGFAPGSYSIIDNAYVYRASNAHAWVEVYFDGYGWVMFDPSPASGDLFNTSDLLRAVTGTVDFLQQLFVLDPAATQQTILGALLALWETIVSYGPMAVGAGLLLALLFLVWLRWARRPRRLRKARLAPENAVIASYVGVREQLILLGLRPDPGDTARSYLHRAAAATDGAGEALTSMIPLYERAAFAPVAITGDDEEQARGILARVRQWVMTELQRQRRERRR